ncbi:MUTL-like protein [Perkinsela sp. CCAP 1560/4]|nr:MUTL-like protein [Perkinsela sp. CCAP 1560/4]|eukprot:KNH09762.1 MUTL-like protein [Perkinsela sp. CCAP 1560/4]
MRIQPLPEEVINQIAAGEVVQSPSAALKELLENALDSGATRIAISYIDSGLHTLRITDNGGGISADNLPLVATRFATSKLRLAHDLQRISTFGFRGEALAALSYVSFLQFITRGSDLAESHNCHLAKYRNNILDSVETISRQDFPFPHGSNGQCGTTVIVENLFYNNSTRRSVFAARKYEEIYKMEELVRHYAIANPGVALSLVRLALPTPGGKSGCVPSSRLSISEKHSHMSTVMRSLYGEAFMNHMVCLSNDPSSDVMKDTSAKMLENLPKKRILVNGIASDPYYSHPKSKQMICFVNKRLVNIPTCLRKVCERFYQSILPKKHHPFVFLDLQVPSDAVDVNIHPTKSEVRILYEEQCCAILEDLLQKSVLELLQAQKLETLPPKDAVSVLKQSTYSDSLNCTKTPPQYIDRSLRDVGQMERYVVRSHTSNIPPDTLDNQSKGKCQQESKSTSTPIQTCIKKEELVDEEGIPHCHDTQADSHFPGKFPDPLEVKKEVSNDRLLDPQTNLCEKQTFFSSTLSIKRQTCASVQKRQENETLLLSSIQSILAMFRQDESSDIQNVIMRGTYVGCIADLCVPNPSCHLFIQHQNSLFLLDGELLLTNAAFQHVFWFWERPCWHSLQLTPSLSLESLLGKAQSEVTSNNCLVDVLRAHSDMLAAYFGIGLVESGTKIAHFPLLLGHDYIPNIAGISIVLAQIAHTIAALPDEKECLIGIAKALSVWFAYRPGTRRGIIRGSDEVVSVQIPKMHPSRLIYDQTSDMRSFREMLNEVALVHAEPRQEEHDYILNHGALSSIRKAACYAPPLSVWIPKESAKVESDSRITCIATTEALYKVFERC